MVQAASPKILDIDAPVPSDLFSMDYQAAKWVNDLDTGEWIKSPTMSSAAVARLQGEQGSTVAVGAGLVQAEAPKSESSWITFIAIITVTLLMVICAIFIRKTPLQSIDG